MPQVKRFFSLLPFLVATVCRAVRSLSSRFCLLSRLFQPSLTDAAAAAAAVIDGNIDNGLLQPLLTDAAADVDGADNNADNDSNSETPTSSAFLEDSPLEMVRFSSSPNS